MYVRIVGREVYGSVGASEFSVDSYVDIVVISTDG